MPQRMLSLNTKEVLSELFQQLCIRQLRRRALDDFLSEDEVELIVEDIDPNLPDSERHIFGKRILSVLADSRHWSRERAMLELAFGLDLIGPGRFRSLVQAIEESIEPAIPRLPKARDSVVKPRWDRTNGKLWFGDKEIRNVRICGTATRLERILLAFEKKLWNSSIAEPFNGQFNQSDLHATINQLNRGLKEISFHVRGGGREITWGVKPK